MLYDYLSTCGILRTETSMIYAKELFSCILAMIDFGEASVTTEDETGPLPGTVIKIYSRSHEIYI